MCKKAAEEAFVIIFYRGLIAHSRLSGTIKKPFVTFDIKPALSIKYSIRSDLATSSLIILGLFDFFGDFKIFYRR